MTTLTFSSVDNPEIPVLLLALSIPSSALTINEVVGRAPLSLDGETEMSKIVSGLVSLCSIPAPKDAVESALHAQWLSFALGPVANQIRVSHDLDGVVFAPLHAGLERRAFLTGSPQPSFADWLLFSMLLGRIVHIQASHQFIFSL